jgi:PAS domain S-box-containing protein
LDRFFELSLDLLCIAGLDGFFKRVNPSWTRVLGWSVEELLSRPVADFMHPDDRERTLQARARLAKGIPVIGLENRYRCKDGTYRWLSWQSSLYSEAGLVIAVARDITERRQSDEERLVLSKLESTAVLAGGMAHDFNNLLASLLLNLELLRLVGPVNEAQASHVRQALETVRAAHGLTKQLVSFAHGSRVPGSVLDLKPLLRSAIEAAPAAPRVRFECDIAPDLWPVESEEAQLKQVVNNLIVNALEAMSSGGGVISLRAHNVVLDGVQPEAGASGRHVCFVVTDGGSGISPETRDKVFDPYFSTKRRGPQKGMGLGLTICHAILRQHGGQILVEANPGGGTSVRCYLPAARGQVASAPEKL